MPKKMTALAEDANDDEGFDDDYRPANSKARMVDWVQSLKLPSTFLFAAPTVAIVTTVIFKDATTPLAQVAPVVIIIVAVLLIPLSLVSQLIGFSFDAETDGLSYPYYAIRRSVRLSEISDANCETTSKRVVDVWESLGEKNPKFKSSKRYIVNMSGGFGTRRVIFHSKYKRDQFLSLLRSYAPNCRITRWI